MKKDLNSIKMRTPFAPKHAVDSLTPVSENHPAPNPRASQMVARIPSECGDLMDELKNVTCNGKNNDAPAVAVLPSVLLSLVPPMLLHLLANCNGVVGSDATIVVVMFHGKVHG
jgi:hypothetical protein